MKQNEWNLYLKKTLIPLYQEKQFCELCGGTWGLSFHHIIRRSKGGENNINNIILLCAECHHKADNGAGYKDFNQKIIYYAKSRSLDNADYFVNLKL